MDYGKGHDDEGEEVGLKLRFISTIRKLDQNDCVRSAPIKGLFLSPKYINFMTDENLCTGDICETVVFISEPPLVTKIEILNKEEYKEGIYIYEGKFIDLAYIEERLINEAVFKLKGKAHKHDRC